MTTLWPICTRLSIFAPSPITVSRLAPRSIVTPAPISTSSWMMTRPICGTLRWPRGAEREAEAVLPDMRARMDDHPVADQRRHDRRRRADRAVAADAHLRADDRVGADHRAGADLGAAARSRRRGRRRRPPRAARRDGRCAAATRRSRRTIDPGLTADGIELRHHHRHGAVGLARRSARRSRPARLRRNRGATSAAAARVARNASRYRGLSRKVRSPGPGLVERRDVAR